MWKKMTEIFSKKDNLLSLIALSVSIFILLVDFFGEGFKVNTTFEVILFVLTLLAVSQIVERETRFGEINTSMGKLKSAIATLGRHLFVIDKKISWRKR